MLFNHLTASPTSGATTTTTATESQSQSSASAVKRFRFTVDSDVLTEEQRQFYEDNGYILFRKVIPMDRVEFYIKRFLEIANGAERAPTMLMMRDVAVAKKKQLGDRAITKLQDFQDDEQLFAYCSEPNQLHIVQGIIGQDVNSVHTMLINKPPDAGVGSSRHPPHQDLWYFPFRPADKIVASWTALQKIDRQNGCLCVIPGSHKGELLKHEYPNDGVVNKAYHGIQGYTEKDMESMLHVEMEVGDTIFFHPLLIHGSGRNNSDRTRKAISCHYAASDCGFIDVRGTMQQDIAKEIEHMAKMKGLEGVGFNQIWVMKSRLVSGKEGAFHNTA